MVIVKRKSLVLSFLFYLTLVGTIRAKVVRVQNASSVTSSGRTAETLESIFLDGTGNKVISTFSVNSALIPLKLGADGVTKAELEVALKGFDDERTVSEPENPDSDLSSTTVVFSSPYLTLFPEFKEALAKVNITSLEGFDFRNYEAINDFVKNATKGLITDLIGPNTLRKDTDLVIINGVHFDAPWEYPFQATYRDVPFTLSDGTVQEIPMMYQKSSNYISKVKELDATILELPYKSLTKVLRIYLPSKHDGLPTLLKKLQTFNTSAFIFKLSEIEVTLPQFKIETQIRVTNGLERLGLKSLITSTANLSRISSKPLRVDEIISKCVIEVNEKGTKAGSATGAFVIPLSGFIAEEFLANRPFYFEIRDTTKAGSYFSGVFTTPDPPTVVPEAEMSVFVSRLNHRPETPKVTTGKSGPPQKVTGDKGPSPVEEEEAPWWLHTGKPEYLNPSTAETVQVTPRFQQPEPIYPSSIRFLLKDPNTQGVIDTHLRNVSINSVI